MLVAFQEVEDNLAALQNPAGRSQDGRCRRGRGAAFFGSVHHAIRGGVTNYLEVTTAQSAALSDEVTALEILIRRMNASVLLIKAIGGGWNVSQIPPV